MEERLNHDLKEMHGEQRVEAEIKKLSTTIINIKQNYLKKDIIKGNAWMANKCIHEREKSKKSILQYIFLYI